MGQIPFTSPPEEGRLRIFTPVKIQRLRPGLNPQTWVPEASMLTTRPPKIFWGKTPCSLSHESWRFGRTSYLSLQGGIWQVVGEGRDNTDIWMTNSERRGCDLLRASLNCILNACLVLVLKMEAVNSLKRSHPTANYMNLSPRRP